MTGERDPVQRTKLDRLAGRLEKDRPTRTRSLQIILLLSLLAWLPVILLLLWIF